MPMYLYHIRVLCLIGSFTIISLLPTQAQHVQVSDPVPVANELDYQLIGRFGDQVLLYRKTETKFYIQSFSYENLQHNWVKTITFDHKEVTPFKIVSHDNSFSVLYYYHQKGDTYVRGCEFSTMAEEVLDFPMGTFSGAFSAHRQHTTHAVNKRYLLVYFPLYNGTIEAVNFDFHQKKTLWQKHLSYQGLTYTQHFNQLLVNNMGEVYAIYNQHNNKRQRKKHQFIIHKLDKEGNDQEQIIPFHNYQSYDMSIQYDEINQRLVAAGLYATEQTNLSNGIFYFNTDLQSPPIVQTSPLEENFMRSLTGKRKKKLMGVQNFDICQVVLRKDGGALLIAEQRFSYESTAAFYEEERSTPQADYLYENILVASIHPSGKVYWKDVLFKSQSSENDQGRCSSFFTVMTNSNIRFVYNNNISWDTSIFEYVINSQGEVQRNVVAHQERKSGLLPQLSSGLQVSAFEMLALSERDQKLRVLKINYQPTLKTALR